MKFRCICGQVIFDNTDNIATKGYVLADQDVFSAFESQEDDHASLRAVLSMRRCAFECDQCGRLGIFKASKEWVWFSPEAEGYQGILKGQQQVSTPHTRSEKDV
jgi:hypothetical protein